MIKPVENRANIFYIPHGGGPLPLFGDAGHTELVHFLQNAAKELKRPSAILVISAHWEAQAVTITGGASPPLVYDYYGFPEEAYTIQYPAPGNPELAERVLSLLSDGGIPARIDQERGFDHGVFVPLILMYPQADIPCVQLSLVKGLDPLVHLKIGRALAPLLSEDVLILGSGFSFHNTREFFGKRQGQDSQNDAFQAWLSELCTNQDYTEAARAKQFAEWQQAPFARYCHPREEHLLPIHVCYGMAGAPAKRVDELTVLGKRCIAVLW